MNRSYPGKARVQALLWLGWMALGREGGEEGRTGPVHKGLVSHARRLQVTWKIMGRHCMILSKRDMIQAVFGTLAV